MANILELRRNWLLGGAATLALALGAGPAYAQPGTPQDPPAEGSEAGEAEDDDAIVVTGFRASLASATAEKRENDQIVESVTAEDIGRLPDASIAESIARLPGLTAQRLSGRANVISIRGLGPDFSQTLLNGREQTSTGDNRAVEFDQYPSEVVRQVVVYKSPMASLVGQGLVGTVDIRTIRPLEVRNPILAIGARGSYNDLGRLNAGSNSRGHRINATFVDQFADDTVGVALAASYMDEPYQIQEFNAWGYADTGVGRVIGGSKSYVTSTQLRRLGLSGTVQGQATPELLFTLDAFYSHFDDDQIKRGIELPLAFSTGGTPGTVEDGFVRSGTFFPVEGVVRNDTFERRADLYSFGFNARYEGDSGWNAWVDFGYSLTDRRELIFESYSGTGYGGGNGATDTIGFESGPNGTTFDPTLDYSDPNLILLTDPLGWGGSRVQAGYWNDRIVEDELIQYRGEIQRELDGFFSSFRVGANYTDREKSLTPDEAFIAIASGANQIAIPQQYLLRPTNLDYLGLGPMVSYDPRALVRDGIYRLDFRTDAQDVLAKAYTVTENLMTFYAQADLEAEMGSSTLTGNFGVQAVRTDQSSTGLVFLNGVGTSQTFGDEYWDILPSLNLSMRFDNDFVIRFAAAREIQRPRMDQMRVSIGYGLDRSGPTPIIRGSGGNPLLRPYRANAVDLNFEKYFGNNGYIALQLFYKDLENFIYDPVEAPFDYTGFPLSPGDEADVTTRIGTINQPVNTGGGHFYGAELAATLPFGEVVDLLDGFGFTGGLSYTKTSVRQTPNSPPTDILGYSRWVANGTLFYEQSGFSARASVRHRTSFLGELSGFGGNRTNRRALGETIVDAQIGYDFQEGSALEGLSIFLQGQNLTDEPFVTISAPDRPLEVIDHQTFGRRFLAGFTFRF
jgi:iron complex outermembrane receptor protein